MKMKQFLMMSMVALVAVTMTSCMHVKVDGKDWSFGKGLVNDTPTQVHELGQVTAMQPFDEMAVAGPFNVIYEQGENYSVRVEGTVEQLEKMTIYVKGHELYVDRRKAKYNDFDGLQVFVTSPTIEGFDLAGSCKVTAPKELNVDKMSIDGAGSTQVTLAQLTCTELEIDIAGSCDVTMGPVKADKVSSDIAGSGNIEMAALICKTVHNEIAGSGKVTYDNMNVEHVSSDIAGSGKVILRGKVGSHTEDIAGSGKVDVTGLN